MIIGKTRIADYIISVCKDLNPKVMVAREYIVYAASKNPDDKKRMKDILDNNSYFKTEEEISEFYNKKISQINTYWKSLKDGDKIEAFSDSDFCRIIFKDVIKNDDFK